MPFDWAAAGFGLKILQWVLRWFRPGRRDHASYPPTETIRVVATDERDQHWCWGTNHHRTGPVRVMSTRGSFRVTTISPHLDAGIIRTELVLWHWDRWRPRILRVGGFALVSNGQEYPMWSSEGAIPCGETREVHGDWLIEPAFRAENDTRPFKARAYFVDQLGNPHTTRRKMTFRFRG